MDIQTNVNALPPDLYARLLNVIEASLGDVFPSVALAVFHEGRLVLDIGSGVIDPTEQEGIAVVTPATRFDLASVTKLFTATCFLSLVSRGMIGLDDPLVKVIPEFGAVSPRPVDGGQDPHSKERLATPAEMVGQAVEPERVTFRHVLTHTSGLAPWRDVYNAAGPAPTPPDIPDPIGRDERWAKGLAAICGYAFVGQVGSAVRYSDLGLMLLGEATTRVWYGGDVVGSAAVAPGHSHLGLDMAIWEGICERLKLESPCFNPVRNGVDRMTIAPTEDDPGWRKRRAWGEVHDENACGVGGVVGHAGLFANAGDVAAFGQAWLAQDSQLRIDPALMDEATREHAETNGERRGLGWMLKAREGSSAGDKLSPDTFGHTGFTGTSLWIDPERALVVATLTNRVYPGRWKEGIHDFRRAVHDTLADI